MAKMKVWCFDHYGPPSVLELRERDIPTPQKGEVLVKILATAINPSDVKNLAGSFRSALPRVPGRDFAGIIAGGDGPQHAEIWGSGPGWGVTHDGAHAEYVIIPADWVSTKPEGLSMEEAAAVGVPYLAAWSALITAGNIQSGESLLVTGAAGAVGRAATQIAHWRGARVIGASLSLDNPSGTNSMIDTTKQRLAEEVLKRTGGKGVDICLDTVGGPLFEQCLSSLRSGGRQIAIASNPQVVSFNLVDFYHGQKRLLGVDTMQLSGAEIANLMDQLRNGFDDGAFAPPKVRTWDFEDAARAYDTIAKDGGGEKQVLTLHK